MALKYLFDPIFEVVNSAGNPATGGYIEVYVHGTRDKYYCASDFDGTLLPFKIPLDSIGSNVVLADDSNAYDVYVYNRYGTLLMSRYKVDPVGGIGGGVKPSDLKPLTLKRGEHTIGSYSPLQQKTIDIGDSVLFVPDDTDDLHAKITQMLSNGTTPVLTKAVTVGGVESVYRYYPTARTGASSDYYFMGYNGGLIEFAKVKDDDSVSYETYDGGEGRIVYIWYGDPDIYAKVSDAFAAGLVPVIKRTVANQTTYYWPVNNTAYQEPVGAEIDHRANNGYYFIGKETTFESGTDTPINDVKMLWVRPDNTKNVSGIPELYTARSKHTGITGLKVVTNKFGQVTELSDGSISAFEMYTGTHIRHVLTAANISNGYFDVVLDLPEMKINGITLTPEFVKTFYLLFTVSIANQEFNGSICSLRRMDVFCNYDGSFSPDATSLICFVGDFNKDEFGRVLDYHYYQHQKQYSYTFVKRITGRNSVMTGIVIRCYINPDYEPDPIVPGLEWVCSGVRLIVESPIDDFDSIVSDITTVTASNTLRFRFSDPDYSPVTAGVGTSGTWTKRLEYQALTGDNVWDWTNYNSNWASAFADAWTSDDMEVELVAAGNTSAITDVRLLFSRCSALRSAIAFDTSNVSEFNGMFVDCTNLEEVPYFNTDSASNVNGMFMECTKVKSGALALYTRMSGQATPPDFYGGAFADCGKDTTEGYAELLQIPASWGGLAP